MPKVPFWVFIIIALLYLSAARVDIMDIDAAQYAEISREMLLSGDYLHIMDRGMDYLDKPPLLFWLSALSMKVLGVGNLGYKLPSMLLAIWSLYATYRLARLLYGPATGRIAALVLATCQGMFLMTNDVRCDTLLMSTVITAIWLIQEWATGRKLWHLLAGCAAIAAGMMTKGPIALMVPVFCFLPHWVLHRQWKQLLHPAYLLGLVLIALLLVPMSMGLYQQFDLQPDKLVNGQKGVSGLRFFYWSQSFGRITGENPWKNAVDISFLFVNMLWSFLPWVFLLVPALIINVVQLVRQKFRLQPGQEWLTTGGFVLTYLALGSSAYQLPHYIFVAFPLAAILVAQLISQLQAGSVYPTLLRVLRPFMGVIAALVLVAMMLLIALVFPTHPAVLAVAGVGCLAWVYLAASKRVAGKLLWLPAAAMVVANVFLTHYLYQPLLHYQVGARMGRYVHDNRIAASDLWIYKVDDPLNSFHFYAQYVLHGTNDLAATNDKKYVLTMGPGLQDLLAQGRVADTVVQGELFKVSELTPDFLNPATRHKAVRPYYLLRMK